MPLTTHVVRQPKRSVSFSTPDGFKYAPVMEVDPIRSFLRTFSKEKKQWNVLIEATLCYGIHCLSNNFSLHALRVEDISDLTVEVLKQPRRYHARQSRNANQKSSKSISAKHNSHSPNRRFKASTSWRKGDKSYGSPEDDDHEVENPVASKPKMKSHSNPIDLYQNILGPGMMDAALRQFGKSGYPVEPVTCQKARQSFGELLHGSSYLLHQDPFHGTVPGNQGLSFAQYLKGFVRYAMIELDGKIDEEQSEEESEEDEPIRSEPIRPLKEKRNPVTKVQSRSSRCLDPKVKIIATKERPLSTKDLPTKKASSKPSTESQTAKKSVASAAKKQNPSYLNHVQSKVKPELDQRRKKLLRVRKNQTQRLKEALAKKRLDEYQAKYEQSRLEASGARLAKSIPSFSKPKQKIPLGEHLGMSAIEIADSFHSGSLLNKFKPRDNSREREEEKEKDPASNDDDAERRPSNQNMSSSPLKTQEQQYELYGRASVNENVLYPPFREKVRVYPKNQAYTGWLGDFGPPHTHTIKAREQWNTVDDDDEDHDLALDHDAQCYIDSANERCGSRKNPIEWDFAAIEREAQRNHEEGTAKPSLSWLQDNDDDDA